MGVFTGRDGVRVGHELLAQAARVAEAGVWAALHRALLEHMEQAGQLDWSRASLDSTSLAAKKGGLKRGRTLRTGAGRVRSATLSWTHTVPRSASP